ncbi:hypothetical protein DICA4_F14532 [Diutina catenulata]
MGHSIADDGSGSALSQQKASSNQAVSASTAGIRAIVYQLQALYFRTPVKLFRPSRFDYLAYVRQLANKYTGILDKPYSFRTHSSLGIIISVWRNEGWRFIPEKVLPPLLANSATGLILYVTYLTTLEHLESSKRPVGDGRSDYPGITKLGGNPTSGTANSNKRDLVYSPTDTWRAGFVAGAAQSLAAAPIDAIYTRSSAAEMLSGNHENLWVYGFNKLREIGLVGVFAGYSISLVKESVGFAFYFSTFETVKTHGYRAAYSLIKWWRQLNANIRDKLSYFSSSPPPVVDPEFIRNERTRSTRILKSSFILIAGASAAFSLLAVQYPISKIQKVHLSRLEAMDIYDANLGKKPFFHLYYNSYVDTFRQVGRLKRRSKLTWFAFMYRGFVRNALTTVPATSIGLLVFEIMRTKLADKLDENDVLGA